MARGGAHRRGDRGGAYGFRESHAYSGWWVSGDVIWARTLERNPHSWLAEQNLGNALMRRGHYEEALGHFRRVLAVRPDSANIHFNLAEALEKLGQAGGAAQDQYEQTVKLNPAYAEAYVKLADYLEKSSRKSEALAQYERAVKFMPDSAQLRYNLGSLLIGSGNLPAALEQLEIAVKLDPQIATAHENLGGVCWLNRAGCPRRLCNFRAAIQIDDRYVIARNNLGPCPSPRPATFPKPSTNLNKCSIFQSPREPGQVATI